MNFKGFGQLTLGQELKPQVAWQVWCSSAISFAHVSLLFPQGGPTTALEKLLNLIMFIKIGPGLIVLPVEMTT